MIVSLLFDVVVVVIIIEEVLLLLLKEVVTLELFKGAAVVVVPLFRMVVIEALEFVPRVLSIDGVNVVPVEIVDKLLIMFDVCTLENEGVVVFLVVVNCDDPFKFIMRFFFKVFFKTKWATNQVNVYLLAIVAVALFYFCVDIFDVHIRTGI